jgi:hypothetical protein
MSTADEALDEAGKTVEDYAALDRAIGSVLFNVSNFPERAQARLLGQNMRPLNEKLADAILAAGFRRPSPPTDKQLEAAAKALWVAQQDVAGWARQVVDDVFSPADDWPDEALRCYEQAQEAFAAAARVGGAA